MKTHVQICGNVHLRLRAALALLVAVLAGCASQPLPDDNVQGRVVTRTSNATVWATPEAEAAVAQAAAAQRSPAPRPAATRPAPAAPAPAAGVAAPEAGAAGRAAPAAAVAALAAPGYIVYFDFDRFDIKDEFKSLLEAHALALAADKAARLVIEGHADERGGAEYNLALGQKRAQAVARALALLGAGDAQVEAVSFGDTRPAVPESTEDAWARNRRAEIKRR